MYINYYLLVPKFMLTEERNITRKGFSSTGGVPTFLQVWDILVLFWFNTFPSNDNPTGKIITQR